MDNPPLNPQLVQGICDGFYSLILPASLNPNLLQPSRLALEDSLNRVPAKYKFFGHWFSFLLFICLTWLPRLAGTG